MQSKILIEPMLVGREQELNQLENYLRLAIEGKGSTVFVSGEAGAGKTRLISEFLNRAKKQGVTTLTGWCLSNAAVPYFPFFEAFNAYLSGEPERERIGPEELKVTEWLMGPSQAEKIGKSQVVSPHVWKDQTFAAVTNTLLAISARKPVILFVDDLHWADSASLALIHYIARAISSEKVLLLATFRREQLAPDSEGRPPPLVESLRLMRREDLFNEIELANLNQASVSALAKNMLGGDLQEEFVEKLLKKSQGNPLFVVESMRMLNERQALVREGNQWRLPTHTLGIPPKIKDIILQRLSVLLRSQRRVLDAASVIGEKFNVEVLVFMLGLSRLEIIEILDTIANDTSLVYSEGELYVFDHARSRDTIYEEVSPALKREYHAKVAEKLESTLKNCKLALSEVAYHYAQAGYTAKAIKYALAAGQDALARWSNSQAIEHFAYVLQNASVEYAEEKRTSLEGIGDAYAASYLYEEAIKTFEALADSETGAIRLRALRKAMDAAFLKGDKPDLLLEYAKKAEGLAVYDRLEMARVLDSRGRAFHWAGRGNLKMDLADYEAALQVFEEENSIPDVAEALFRSGGVSCFFEDLREKGICELLRSAAIFRELGDVRKEMEVTAATGSGFAVVGLFPEAKRQFDYVLSIGEKLGVFAELAEARTTLGILDEIEGKTDETFSQALKTLEYSKKTDMHWIQAAANSTLTRLYSKRGDLKHADDYFDKLAQLPSEVLAVALVRWFLPLSQAVYFAAKDRWEESNRFFETVFERLREHSPVGAISHQLDVLGNYAWALERQGRSDEANATLKKCWRIRQEVDERFEHANLQAYLLVRRQVVVGEEFEMQLDLVNVGRKPASLVEVKNALVEDFTVLSLSPWCSVQGGAIEMKSREVGAFVVETAKLTLKSKKAGVFTLNSQAVYLDDLGVTKTCKLQPFTIVANPPAPKERVAGKVFSGTLALDELLLGGIPENYAVVLTAPSSDERTLLTQKFLKAGTEVDETTFYIAADPKGGKDLAEEYPSSFHFILCNPQTDAIIQDAPNVSKLKGVENLTEIDIALTKVLRTLNTTVTKPKRACIEIVSDVLLQHHAVTTRKWLSALLPTLKNKGFTVLATVNPRMHPAEEVEAILSLFDGEISIREKESPKGMSSFLMIKKMTGQNYLKNEIALTEA